MIKWIKYNEIYPLQLFFLIPSVQIGVGVLSLYGDIHKAGAGNDAWISLLVGGLIAQTGVFLVVKLASYFPRDNIYQFSQNLLGKIFGILLALLLILYFTFSGAFILRSFVSALKMWAFPRTPVPVLIILMVVPCFYVARNGLKVTARYSQAVLILSFWLILVLFFPLKFGDYRNLLPIGDAGLVNILKASLTPSFALIGYEIILFVYPFITDKRKVLAAASLGNAVTVMVYLLVVIISTKYLNGSAPVLSFSTLELLEVFRTSVIERIDTIVLAFWVLIVTTTVIVYLWAAALGTYTILGVKDFKVNVLIFSFLFLIISLLPQTEFQVKTAQEYIGYAGLAIGTLLPIMLLVLSKLKGVKGTE